MKTVGFIGTGNMGGALARAAAKSLPGQQILLANRTREKAEALAAELGCECGDNVQTAESCRYIFLGIKPQMAAEVLKEIAPALRGRAQSGSRFVLVSMIAGLSAEKICALAGGEYPVIRIMPNTPAAVGEGMILYASNARTEKSEEEEFLRVMAPAGRADRLDERLMDAGSAVSGCGPAFVCMLIEAMADGGVACGLPRKKALEYAAQMAAGTAKLLLETGGHPGELKDAVCSPGGSTIAGVRALEEGGFRAAAMNAVIAAFEKTKELA